MNFILRIRVLALTAGCIAFLLCWSAAYADSIFSIRFESRELVFDIEKQMVSSELKTRINGNNYTIAAGRFQYNFKTNMLRASGNVVFHYKQSSNPMYPDLGETNSDGEDYFTGKELVLNVEFGEALIYPKGMDGEPIAFETSTGRVIPQLKHIGEMPVYIPAPENNVVICFELFFSSTNKLYMYDATYIPAEGSQYYTALLVTDGANLTFDTDFTRDIHGIKSYSPVSQNKLAAVGAGYLEGTVWIDDKPRAATFLDVEYYQNDKEGFTLLTPTISRTVSIGNFGAAASLGTNEFENTGTISVSRYTGGRNEYGAVFSRQIDDYHYELWDVNYHTSFTSFNTYATFWDDDDRLNVYYNNYSYSDSADFPQKQILRYGYLNYRLDPAPVFSGTNMFGLDAIASNTNIQETSDITDPESYSRTDSHVNSFVISPLLITRPIKITGKMSVVQRMQYNVDFKKYHHNYYIYDSGVPVYTMGDTPSVSEYSFDSRTRLILPIDESSIFDMTFDYGKSYGSETSTILPGLALTLNGQDYLFIGSQHDFTTRDWDSLFFDFVLRRKGDTRFVYSTCYDLMEDDTVAENFGLLADFKHGTFEVSYEDVASEFKIAFFDRTNPDTNKSKNVFRNLNPSRVR
jgi:hypothetical protein